MVCVRALFVVGGWIGCGGLFLGFLCGLGCVGGRWGGWF